MNNIFIRLISLLFVVFVVWNAFGDDKSITVFATSDIHGNIESEDAGILRLATVLKKEVSTAGGYEKSIIIDCGDFSQGSVEASLTKGEIIFKLLDYLHYDIVVPGNHDFDYGLRRLIENKKEISAEILCGNLSLSGDKNLFKSWKIINKNGLKIAVIGITYPGIECEDVESSLSFKTVSVINTVKRILPEVVSEKPDLIILAIHGGLYNSGWSLNSIVRKLPEIDIVVAGHTHEEISGKLLYNHTYFIQTGSHAEYLGKIVVRMVNGKKEINSYLIPVSKAKIDSELDEKFNSVLEDLKRKKGTIIAYSESRIDLSQLAADAILEETQADVAILGLSESSKTLKGKIRYKDVFNAVPYEDMVVTMKVNKNELKSILQELYSYMKKKKKYKKVLYSGVSFEKVKGEIIDLKFDNKNIDDEKITLALSSYYIEYPGNKFPEIREIAKDSKSGYRNTGILLRDALIDYLKKHFPTKQNQK